MSRIRAVETICLESTDIETVIKRIFSGVLPEWYTSGLHTVRRELKWLSAVKMVTVTRLTSLNTQRSFAWLPGNQTNIESFSVRARVAKVQTPISPRPRAPRYQYGTVHRKTRFRVYPYFFFFCLLPIIPPEVVAAANFNLLVAVPMRHLMVFGHLS